MTLTELRSLEKKIAKAITRYEVRQKKKALISLKAKAKEMGFSFDELAEVVVQSTAPKKPRKKIAPKYANPADKSQTWTGRGRHPSWVVEALEAGKSIDDLTI